MSRAAVAYDSDAAHSVKSRTSSLRVNKPGDAYEVEADRVAETVSNGGRLSSSLGGWSISKLDMSYVQRDGADTAASTGASIVPKPNNYAEGLGKIGEAFLKTDLGKQITDAAQKDPLVKGTESFFDSLPGKIVAGAAAAGTVTALAAEHKALPAQLPAIPLDKVKPGLSVKITYQGPVDKPTQASITFSYTPKSATDEKKQKQAATERQHSAWARDAADLRQFQEGLKSPQQKQQEAEDAQHALDAWVTRPGANTLSGGIDTSRFLPKMQDKPSGPQLTVPSAVGPQRKSPSLLDKTLELAPTTGPLATAATAKPDADAKKKEELPVQRRAEPSATIYADSADVEAVIHSSGRPLDIATRRSMETRIGFDFSKVRVHTDARAADSARSLGARAYTVGNHVVFSAGRFAPESSAGRKLLAHELTHVVQQSPAIARRPAGITQAPAQVQRDEEDQGPSLIRDPKGWVLHKITRIPGYKLFCGLIGQDLATGAPAKVEPGELLQEILKLIPGGQEAYERVTAAAGALGKAYDWVMAQLTERKLTLSDMKDLIQQAIDSITPSDAWPGNWGAAFDRLVGIFRPAFDRVVDFAKAVFNRLFEIVVEFVVEKTGPLGQKILGFLTKARNTFLIIAKDPIKFVGYLVDAVKQGFQNFGKNFLSHLQDSLMDFLFGEVATKLKPPKSFSIPALFDLVLDVLDLRYGSFRSRLVAKTSEATVSFLEGAFDFLMRLVHARSFSEAWDIFQQKANDIIESLVNGAIDAIKNWVVSKVVQAAIVKVVELFNPASALVAAIEAIYHTIVTLIEKGKQLLEVLNSVIDSIDNIARGNISQAAGFIEKSMAKALNFVLAFLAEQAGLGGIGETIRGFLTKARDAVLNAFDKVIDWVIGKTKKLVERGKVAAGKALGWWQQRKDLLIDGEEHAVFLDGTADAPKLMVASEPAKPVDEYLDTVEKELPKSGGNQKKQQISEIKKKVPDLVAPLPEPAGDAAKQASPEAAKPDPNADKVEKKKAIFAEMAERIRKLGFPKPPRPEPYFVYDPPRSDGGGVKATAPMLADNHPKGTHVSPSHRPKILTNLGKIEQQKHYVQGHLINNNLGGLGNLDENLTPIRRSANAVHLSQVEKHVKNAVNEKGVVVRYEVKADYSGSHTVSDPLQKLRDLKTKQPLDEKQTSQLNELEAEQHLCTGINWKVDFLEQDDNGKWAAVSGKTQEDRVPHDINSPVS